MGRLHNSMAVCPYAHVPIGPYCVHVRICPWSTNAPCRILFWDSIGASMYGIQTLDSLSRILHYGIGIGTPMLRKLYYVSYRRDFIIGILNGMPT